MNRNKKGVMPVLTRETYKSIKKFDRQQFEGFCRELYQYGVEDGRASVPGTDIEKIWEAIAATKGIGPKKLAEIKENVEKLFG